MTRQITVDNVRKTYDEVTALNEISLEVPAGSSFGLLGTNGAGKTTLFKILVGLTQPDSGEVWVGDQRVSTAGTTLRDHIGYLPERVGFPNHLTGREALQFQSQIRGLPGSSRISEVLDMVGLTDEAANRSVAGYSNGMRRRLGLAGAIIGNPEVLLLDEPTAGLDPQGVREFHNIIRQIQDQSNVTVLMASHVLSEVERLCDEVAILHNGAALAIGSVDDIAGSAAVTIRLRPKTPEGVSELKDRLADFGDLQSTQEVIKIACNPRELPRVFAVADDCIELDAAMIEETGLEAAFHKNLSLEAES